MPLSSPPTFNPAAYGIALGASGTVLTSTGANSAPTFQPAPGGAPGGADTNVQFNDGGAFGGDDALAWNKSTHILFVGNNATAGAVKGATGTTNGKNLTLSGGDAGNGAGGGLNFIATDATSASDGGGNITFTAGASSGSGTGGAFTANAGDAIDTGNGGNLTFTSGDGGLTDGNAGSINFTAGTGQDGTGAGGSINFTAGNAVAGTGNAGSVTLAAGTSAGGTNGSLFFKLGSATPLTLNATGLTLSQTEPRILLNASGGGADGKLCDLDVTPTLISLRTRTDADGAGVNILTATRTAASTAITNVTLGNATNNPTFTLAGTGNATFGGQVSATRVNVTGSSAPAAGIYASGANTIGVATSSTLRLSISTTQVLSTLPFVAPNGTAAAPSITFTGATGSGFYGDGSATVLMALGGAAAVAFNGATTTGAQTATFVATNKPGTGTAAPIAWLPVLTAGGTQGYIPIFGA